MGQVAHLVQIDDAALVAVAAPIACFVHWVGIVLAAHGPAERHVPCSVAVFVEHGLAGYPVLDDVAAPPAADNDLVLFAECFGDAAPAGTDLGACRGRACCGDAAFAVMIVALAQAVALAGSVLAVVAVLVPRVGPAVVPRWAVESPWFVFVGRADEGLHSCLLQR